MRHMTHPPHYLPRNVYLPRCYRNGATYEGAVLDCGVPDLARLVLNLRRQQLARMNMQVSGDRGMRA
ncbi:hypothetical protein [Belnapia rosea]|uniref:hypothetical protein n=1 Tax=Belnapia rosea TaxID=938405 RepID=UPI0015A326ED|nr:hypothetical protein [Belnapia rosea]